MLGYLLYTFGVVLSGVFEVFCACLFDFADLVWIIAWVRFGCAELWWLFLLYMMDGLVMRCVYG